MREKVLVAVAHPDDETIWMGNMLLKNRGKWDTTIVSLCRKDDPDRAPKFRKVCGLYNAKSAMSDLEDEKLNAISLDETVRRLKEIAGKSYDMIFTHGKNGEYGHIRHKEVHNAVNLMLREKSISCQKAFNFSYERKGKYAYPKRNSEIFIDFGEKMLEEKKRIIRQVYGFGKNGFEDICCRQAEAFDEVKLR